MNSNTRKMLWKKYEPRFELIDIKSISSRFKLWMKITFLVIFQYLYLNLWNSIAMHNFKCPNENSCSAHTNRNDHFIDRTLSIIESKHPKLKALKYHYCTQLLIFGSENPFVQGLSYICLQRKKLHPKNENKECWDAISYCLVPKMFCQNGTFKFYFQF